MTLDIIYLIGGIALLYFGAEGLIWGSYRSALRFGVTPLVGGLIVVAMATSMPELAATLTAQLYGQSGDIAMGNVIGSNIANVGLILGISALIRPLEILPQMRKREVPIMLGVSVLFILMCLTDRLGRVFGLILVILLIVYVILQIYWGKRDRQPHHDEEADRVGKSWTKDMIYVGLGIIGLVIGSIALVEGATNLARAAGIADAVIGLTIVAIGTSLPELAASALAAARNQTDIAVGNVVGSNVFNLLFVSGLVALISPLTFSAQLAHVDALIMLAFSLLLWVTMWFGKTITRLEGAGLVILYLLYIVFLVT